MNAIKFGGMRSTKRLNPFINSKYSRVGEGVDGTISGVVTELGLPVARRVMCYHRYSGRLTAIGYSDNNGRYRFNGLIKDVKYYVTSVDESNGDEQYNAVTQDLITASEVIK